MSTIEQLLAAGPPEADAADSEAITDAFVRRAAAEGLVDVAWTMVDAPWGDPMLVAATERGLVLVSFGPPEPALDELARRLSPRVLEAPGRLDPVRRELDEYFAGDRTEFDVPLDWSLAKAFRLKVLQRLYADVGFGHVVSYGELATRAGNPKASRAVGTAMATNPIPVVVPCHRVLRTGGALGGYGGGLHVKRWLLRHEGVTL
jgi:methylated-DNA-[protein]-cysteine S-methyltransferase